MTLSLSSIWSNFSLSTMVEGSLSTAKCKGCGCGRYWGPPKVFGWGMPPNACPSVAYSRQGLESARVWSRVLHVSPPWVEGPVPDQIGVVGSQWVWERSYRHSHQEHVQHWVVYSWDVCEQYIVEVLQIYTGHSVEHRIESIQIFMKATLFISSCQSQSAIGNKTSTISNFCKLFSSIMCWQ